MNESSELVIEALSGKFLTDHPREAAHCLAALPALEAAEILTELDDDVRQQVWNVMGLAPCEAILPGLPDDVAKPVLEKMEPGPASTLLGRFDEAMRLHYLSILRPGVAKELQSFLTYPPNSAGQLMDAKVHIFRPFMTVKETLTYLRSRNQMVSHKLKVVDDSNRLIAHVDSNALILAGPKQTLGEISQSVSAVVRSLDPREEVVSKLEQFKLEEIPVVDANGCFLGVIRHPELIDALREQAIDTMQTMVGVSRDERATSSSWFAVRKRMPWLQVNLLTAFLAAAVVGVFEDTIARFTALAVLLPVVAGQSGNAGAQALAITMRGLALREISIRQWLRVTLKEINTGLWNGVSIAVTCSIGVYFWSGNMALVFVIASSMVIAMVMAGIAGALVPIVLTRLGQDPAVASSIVLTTVTDIAGFMSFLGIATMLSGLLAAG
ncbi:MAG: magnesium transporter [Rhodospirillales bacterium]|nr:magnesium transporter [Rhodospirillales bacterium]